MCVAQFGWLSPVWTQSKYVQVCLVLRIFICSTSAGLYHVRGETVRKGENKKMKKKTKRLQSRTKSEPQNCLPCGRNSCAKSAILSQLPFHQHSCFFMKASFTLPTQNVQTTEAAGETGKCLYHLILMAQTYPKTPLAQPKQLRPLVLVFCRSEQVPICQNCF